MTERQQSRLRTPDQLRRDRRILRAALTAIVNRCGMDIYKTDQVTGKTFAEIATDALAKTNEGRT